MNIVAVIVTCNRVRLLKRALESVAAQTRQAEQVLVISNSHDADITAAEKVVVSQYGYQFYPYQDGVRTHNYAGALNLACELIIKLFAFRVGEDIFFASLDDDDYWAPDYLNLVEQNNRGNDFDLLVAWSHRLAANKTMRPPDALCLNDFLAQNPGLSGSNTFIRFTTLLQAGAFDESCVSCVDRDLMVRVLQLQPRPAIKVIQKVLVNIDDCATRERVTNQTKKKIAGLRYFYYKYRPLMNQTVEDKFFRSARDRFGLDKYQITETDPLQIPAPDYVPFVFSGNSDNRKQYLMVVGLVCGSEKNFTTMLQRLAVIPIDQIVVIANFEPPPGPNDVRAAGFRKKCKIINKNQVKAGLANGLYGDAFAKYTEINSIPLGRTILHYHLYQETNGLAEEQVVFWVIDDDIMFGTYSVQTTPVDIFAIIEQGREKRLDAIVGGMAKDPPLPSFFSMRCQLIDFWYNAMRIQSGLAPTPSRMVEKPEYYHDLSDAHTDHLEHPLYHNHSADRNALENILAGKAVYRPAIQQPNEFSNRMTRRGGNTLVFNKALLRYGPVVTMELENNKMVRRGDLLWSIYHHDIASDRHRAINEHGFSVTHEKTVLSPDADYYCEHEWSKALEDIVGYACNKAVQHSLNKADRGQKRFFKWIFNNFDQFYAAYEGFFVRRISRFIMNMYRIFGLHAMIENFADDLSFNIRFDLLGDFIDRAEKARDKSFVWNNMVTIIHALYSYNDVHSRDKIDSINREALIAYRIPEHKIEQIGRGEEAISYTDGQFVYKCFHSEIIENKPFLEKISMLSEQCQALHALEIFNLQHKLKTIPVIKRQYEQAAEEKSIKPDEIIAFMKFCKQAKIVFTNIAPKNIIITAEGFRMIDYGRSCKPYDDETFNDALIRAYMLIKNPATTDSNPFRIEYRLRNPASYAGWERLQWAVEPRTKETILDRVVFDMVKHHAPVNILDYGCGKGQLAHRIKQEMATDVYIYDIDCTKIKNHNQLFWYDPQHPKPDFFDLVILNIVLCIVPNDTAQYILTQTSKALKSGGVMIISLCNPDFAHIKNSEFQQRIPSHTGIDHEMLIKKKCRITGKHIDEYHRPATAYLRLFKRYGLVPDPGGIRCLPGVEIDAQATGLNTQGVDIDTLEAASDFKIYVLRKQHRRYVVGKP